MSKKGVRIKVQEEGGIGQGNDEKRKLFSS